MFCRDGSVRSFASPRRGMMCRSPCDSRMRAVRSAGCEVSQVASWHPGSYPDEVAINIFCANSSAPLNLRRRSAWRVTIVHGLLRAVLIDCALCCVAGACSVSRCRFGGRRAPTATKRSIPGDSAFTSKSAIPCSACSFAIGVGWNRMPKPFNVRGPVTTAPGRRMLRFLAVSAVCCASSACGTRSQDDNRAHELGCLPSRQRWRVARRTRCVWPGSRSSDPGRRSTLGGPGAVHLATILAARAIGTAKFEPEKSDRIAKFTPITLPLALNTGPPDPP